MVKKKPAEAVKCRFCEWSRPKFYRYRGRNISGFARLDLHIHEEHIDEWFAIHRETLEEMVDKGLLHSKDGATPADIVAYHSRS